MKRRKAVWVLTFFGILLMLSFIILGGALVEQCARLNGIYSMQKVLVSGKNQADLQGKNSFSIDDIKRLKKELSTKYISYTARSSLVDPSVSSGSMVFPFRLIGTDYMYPMFSGLSLEEGSFITQKQEEEGAMVAIIDEELAWDVFRTKNATGKIIDIFGAAFRIIGVMEKEDSIIGKLTDDGLPEVYIPASVMLELDTTARITDLQIKTADANTLDQNTTDVSAAIRQIGKDPSSYNISDYNLKLALMKQKPLLLVFILGIASMLILLSHVKNLIKEIYFLIRDRCKTDYFSNVIKHNLKGIGFRILEMALSLTGIVLIWIGIRFTLYIPPQNIPDELINISYYSDLIKAAIQEGIQNRGYVAPQAELIVNASDMLLNLFFCISFILGFLLFYEGLRELKELNMNSSKLIPVLGLLFILSMGILTAAAFLSGLPYGTDVKGVLVAWAFIYVNFIITRKESGVKNV
ncbi:ABC transporter permease [Anaerosolibacter carboniphilus]|nr:ABC transporter permease [Anaerosolibacter carboniphilus]